MSNGFSMSPEAMIDNGNKIKTNASKILECLESITNTMRMLPDIYKGAASDEIIQKFDALHSEFKKFEENGIACGELIIADANRTKEAEAKSQQIINQELN